MSGDDQDRAQKLREEQLRESARRKQLEQQEDRAKYGIKKPKAGDQKPPDTGRPEMRRKKED